MNCGSFQTAASIEAVRPVFLMVMGVFLSVIAWRLAKTSGRWTARALVAGALLLGFGYAVMMPLYDAGLIERVSAKTHSHGSVSTPVAWHLVKLVVMNFGWLLFGIGIAMHANIFNSSTPRPRAEAHKITSHEFIA